MANPKYLKQLLPKTYEETVDDAKKVKKAYSFRCEEQLLEDMNTYAEKEGITVPQLISDVMGRFIHNVTLDNTYLSYVSGRYITIKSNANPNVEFEYELRYILNNLDVWVSNRGYVSKYGLYEGGILHEGIDFVVIPETLHGGKLPDMDRTNILTHALNLDRIPDCLYCIYMTVDNSYYVEYEVISWVDAMNKLKEANRYDLISRANAIKKELEKLHQQYITDRSLYDDEIMMWHGAYSKVLKIAEKYNTGAIIDAASSIDNIEYTPLIEKLPDNYILMNELNRIHNTLDEAEEVISRLNKLEEKLHDEEYRQKVWDDLKNKSKISSTEERSSDE